MNNIDTTPATATAIANNEPIVATADSPVNSATLKTPVVLGIAPTQASTSEAPTCASAWSTLSVHSSIPVASVRRRL